MIIATELIGKREQDKLILDSERRGEHAASDVRHPMTQLIEVRL